jgi:hypothetical protein
MKRHLTKILLLIFLAVSSSAQTEILTNSTVIEMSKIGLDKQIILKKISDSPNKFDVSANALIELKKACVADEVIALMLEKGGATKFELDKPNDASQSFSENLPNDETKPFSPAVVNAKDALFNARTVAIEKSSLNPSRQGLEKALFKRKQWQKYNLTLTRYKKDADIYIEIGFVPLSWISHRYVFRIYDRRSGTIITAGETTSWGSLAENMAREITQKMDSVSGK